MYVYADIKENNIFEILLLKMRAFVRFWKFYSKWWAVADDSLGYKVGRYWTDITVFFLNKTVWQACCKLCEQELLK